MVKLDRMSRSASPLDVEVPEARGWPRLRATFVAAAVAPAITTALLSMAAAVETLLWFFEMRDDSPEQRFLLGRVVPPLEDPKQRLHPGGPAEGGRPYYRSHRHSHNSGPKPTAT